MDILNSRTTTLEWAFFGRCAALSMHTIDQRLASKSGVFFILKKLMKKLSKKKFLRKNTIFVHLYAIQCNLTIKKVEKRIKKKPGQIKMYKIKVEFFFSFPS